jgi:DNA polymerase III epsilon subunit-like protein
MSAVPLPLAKKEKKDISMPKYCRRVLCFDTETTGLLPRHKPGTPFPEDAAYPHITQLSWIVYNVATGEVEEVVDQYIRIPDHVEISPESTRVSGITREITVEKGVELAPLLIKFYTAYMRCDTIVAHNMNFDKDVVRQEMRRNKDAIHAIVKDRSRVNTMLGIGTKRFNQVYEIELFCTMANTVELCNIEWVPKFDLRDSLRCAPEISTANPRNLLACAEAARPDFFAEPSKPEQIQNPETIEAIKIEEEEPSTPPQPTPADPSEKEKEKKPSNRKKWPTLTELYTKVFETVPPSDLHNSIIDVLVCLRCFLKVRGATEMQEDVFQKLVLKYSRGSESRVSESRVSSI